MDNLRFEDVEEADPYLSQIPGFTPADRFYSKGEEVAQLYIGTYPNNPVYKYTYIVLTNFSHLG